MSNNRSLQTEDEDLRNLLRSAESILGTKIDSDSTQRYRAPTISTTFAPITTTPTLRTKDLLSSQTSGLSNSSNVDVKISREASDLATLLDSLSHDLKSELAQDSNPISSVRDNTSSEALKPIWASKPSKNIPTTISSPTSTFSATNSLQDSDIDINIMDPSREFDSDGFSAEEASGAYDNVSVVRFCKEFSLRGKHGLYLTAVPNINNSSALQSPSFTSVAASATSSVRETGSGPGVAATQQYLLGAEGQGIGDPLDCLQFININQKDDTGPVRYGMVVSIKAPSAKERLLGLRDGNKLGFWRNLVGQGEKWVVLKACTVATGGQYYQQAAAATGSNGYSKVSFEEPNSKGTAVRLGDMILLQTFKTDNLLTLQTAAEIAGTNSALASFSKDAPGGSSYSVELVYKERNVVIGLGLPDAELWQIGQFGSIPIPLWCRNRPYLSGSYFSMPPTLKPVISELEIRAFPAANLNSVAATASGAAVSLNSLSLASQHLILLRELLSSLSGVEGVYIKVRAQKKKGNGGSSDINIGLSSESTKSNPSLQISLALDVDSADRSIASLVTQLLPVCECALKVREFTRQQSQYEYGMVSHAFCAAVRRIIRDFDALIAQMEHLYIQQNLSLQKMLFLLQPSKVTLYQLERLCLRLSGLTGGHFLEVLHGIALEQGDKKAREMHIHLLEESYKPFLRMLQQWIDRGELLDPYKEFMVLEDSSVSKEALQEDFNAHYWDSRYKLRSSHIPRLLQSHAVKLLSAGKFLNVVRGAMGRVDLTAKAFTYDSAHFDEAKELGQPLQLSLEASDSPMLRTIERAYIRSSSGILNLLEKGHGLSDHLNSLRRFFLLEHGDFFIQFMDSAEDELRKDVKEVSLQRIQALLQLAVQTSTLASDPHREDLTCSLASHNLIQHLHLIQSAGDGSTSADHIGVVGQGLKGVEALTLDYKVGWPLSIVLSRRAITKYQLLSRLLYFSKHVERRVLASWMDHQYTKLLRMHIRAVMGPCYCLRHRMLHFLQNFVYYMTLEVIGPRGHELQHDLSVASDMDDVLELHEKFLDACLKECLLASQELLKILTRIMTTCLLFADYMRKFSVSHGDSHSSGSNYYNSGGKRNSNGVDKDEAAVRAAAYVQYVEKEISHESFNKMLAKFTETFDTQLKEFLDKLWTDSYRRHAQLSNLCIRLDYNGFYSSQYAT